MKLSTKQRNSLPDSDFGLIIDGKRKFPMHDKRHVLLAIKMFKHCPAGKEKELASKINAKIKDFGIKLNPASTGAFTKYATSEAFSLSKEASNIGVLEPIVAGSEVVRPMEGVDIDTIEIPEGRKKFIKYLKRKNEPTEEAFVNPRVLKISKFEARHKPNIDIHQVFANFEKNVDDLIALGEYNDALKYVLDERNTYGVSSWFYKDQIVDTYNMNTPEEYKVQDLAWLISTTTGDERKYLLAVLYRLDSSYGYNLLSKVIDELHELKDKPFESFFSPNFDITFGPFDLEDTRYDYPDHHNFDEYPEFMNAFSLRKLYNLILEKTDFIPDEVSIYMMRMICADMVNKNLIDGYKVYDHGTGGVMVVQKKDCYGIAILESPYIHIYYYHKEDFFIAVNLKSSSTFDVIERCWHEYFNLAKDYEAEDFGNELSFGTYLVSSINDIYQFGLAAFDNRHIDDMKDAAATLFTTARLIKCDNTIKPSTDMNCTMKCKKLIKGIYSLDSSFDFLDFYDGNGYDFYTEGQKALDPKLTYNLIMGV
jgi:hypothetical protein